MYCAILPDGAFKEMRSEWARTKFQYNNSYNAVQAGAWKAAPAAGVLPEGAPFEVTNGGAGLRAILQASAIGHERSCAVLWLIHHHKIVLFRGLLSTSTLVQAVVSPTANNITYRNQTSSAVVEET